MITFLTVNPWVIHTFWAIVIIAMIVIEFFTEDIDTIWFAIGGFVALMLSIFGVGNFIVQFSVFLVLSLILLLTLNKYLKKWMQKRTIKTNTDALVGQKIEILKDADSFNTGEGKINGLVWTVLCEDEDKVNKGDIAIVNKIVGNKLIVKKQ